MDDKLIIRDIEFKSRLWVGTGKYKDFEETARAIEESGADVVTVAVRRTNIFDNKSENLLDFIDPKKYTKTVDLLRSFFLSKGFYEVRTQNCLSILAIGFWRSILNCTTSLEIGQGQRQRSCLGKFPMRMQKVT